MKRFFALILVLLLVFAGCKGNDKPGGTDPAETNTPELAELDPAAVEAVKTEWSKLLEAAEAKEQIELWALEYIESYCDEPTVPNLQRAIAAAEAAVASLKSIKLEECSLTSETLSSLASSGVDMSFVPIEYNSLKDSLPNDIEIWHSILGYVLADSFWEYGIEYLDAWSAVRRDTVELHGLFYAEMSNAVILSLGEDENSATWLEWTENAKTLLGSGYSWCGEEDTLDAEMSETLDKMDEKIVELSSVTGVLSANNAMFSDANQTGDWSAVYEVAVDFEDRFIPIPIPDWGGENRTVYTYRYDEATEDVVFTSVGDDLTVVPDGLIVQYSGISKEAFLSYVDYLGLIGLYYYEGASTVEEDSISLMYLDICQMTVKWRGDTASIYFYDNLPLLTPTWYIIYMVRK